MQTTAGSESYSFIEYGITNDEMERIAAYLRAKAKRAIESRKARTFNANIESALRMKDEIR